MNQSSPQASLVNLYSSEVICNSTEGWTLADFLHMHTLNCQEKSDEFRESSKRLASECDVTSERYCMFMCTQRNHFVKNGIITEDSRFYVPSKTIHRQAKYIIMD